MLFGEKAILGSKVLLEELCSGRWTPVNHLPRTYAMHLLVSDGHLLCVLLMYSFDYLHKRQSGGHGQYGKVIGYVEVCCSLRLVIILCVRYRLFSLNYCQELIWSTVLTIFHSEVKSHYSSHVYHQN